LGCSTKEGKTGRERRWIKNTFEKNREKMIGGVIKTQNTGGRMTGTHGGERENKHLGGEGYTLGSQNLDPGRGGKV